jgi:hypothetical protein
VGLHDLWFSILGRVVDQGFHVPSALRADPWLTPLAGDPRLEALLRQADAGHAASLAAFREAGGEELLGAGAAPS